MHVSCIPCVEILPVASLEQLIHDVYSEEIVQDRAKLEPFLPALTSFVPRVWSTVFNTCTTRFNKYLFLNAPELWRGVSADAWLSMMSSGIVRSYRPSDAFDTGRFDDLKLLSRYVGVDSFQMFFGGARPSMEDREAVKHHALAMTEFYLRDEADDELFDEGDVYVTRGGLRDYQHALQTELPWLLTAAGDAETIRTRVLAYVNRSRT